MFPLTTKRPTHYNFGEKTSYSAHHLGQDYFGTTGTPVYAPFNGKVTTVVGKEGGNTVWFYWDNKIARIMHLQKFAKTGQVNEGDIIGYVDSTGSLSTNSHLHLDISKNNVDINNFSNFIDPESIDWGGEYMRYDLYRDPSGAIYERLNNYALVHIPDPDFLKKYYGDNPTITQVDDIWSVGWIAEDPRPLKEKLAVSYDFATELDKELKSVSESLVGANKAKKIAEENMETSAEMIQTQENEIADLKQSKADLFDEFDSIYSNNYLIKRNIVTNLINAIKHLEGNKMDFSLFGFKDGIIKFLKVLLWVAISGAITALINYFQTLDFGQWVIVQGLINSLLAGLLRWITTKNLTKK